MNGILHNLDQVVNSAVAKKLKGVFDPLAKRVLLDAFSRAQADEGTVWITDPSASALVPVFNSGPEATDFVAKFQQPLDRGVISMVFHHGQPFCENEVYKNATHDQTIDKALEQVTQAMIALPLYFAHETRGVISCVRLGEGEFDAEHLSIMQHATAVVERLIDWQILQQVLEFEEF